MVTPLHIDSGTFLCYRVFVTPQEVIRLPNYTSLYEPRVAERPRTQIGERVPSEDKSWHIGQCVVAACTLAALLPSSFIVSTAILDGDYYKNRPECHAPGVAQRDLLEALQARSMPLEPKYELGSPEYFEDGDRMLDARYRDAARMVGLNVPGFRVRFAELKENVDNLTDQTSNTDYLAQVNDYLADYGVSISLDDYDKLAGADRLTMDDINSAPFKQYLYSVVNTFGVLPIELVQSLGIKKLVIQHNGTVNTNSGIVSDSPGYVHVGGDTIFTDLSSPHVDLIGHEIGHIVAYKMGCYYRNNWDPAWAELNPNNIYTDYGNNPSISGYITVQDMGDPEGEYALAYENLQDTIANSDDFSEVQGARDRLAEVLTRIIAPSDYALSSPQEHWSETFGVLIEAVANNGMLNTENGSEAYPQMYNNWMAMMYRLYNYDQRLVEYFGLILQRLEDDENTIYGKQNGDWHLRGWHKDVRFHSEDSGAIGH